MAMAGAGDDLRHRRLGFHVRRWDVVLNAYLIPLMLKDWPLSIPQAGLVATTNLVGMAVGTILGGSVADQFGRARRSPETVPARTGRGRRRSPDQGARGFATGCLFNRQQTSTRVPGRQAPDAPRTLAAAHGAVRRCRDG